MAKKKAEMSDLNEARLALARLRLGGLGEQDYIAARVLKGLYAKYGPLPKELWNQATTEEGV